MVALLYYLQWDLYCLGYLDQARSRSEAAVEEARKLSPAVQPGPRADHGLLCRLGVTLPRANCWRGRMRWSRSRTSTAFPTIAPWAIVYRGWALTARGQIREGIALLRAGVASYRGTGAVDVRSLPPNLARRRLRTSANQRDEGLGHLAEAERLMAETEDRWAAAELHRVRGDVAALRSRPDRCRAHALPRPSASRAQQSAKLWELRAAISLARLWRDQGTRPKLASSSPQSTTGSPKGLIRRCCKTRKHCSMSSGERRRGAFGRMRRSLAGNIAATVLLVNYPG